MASTSDPVPESDEQREMEAQPGYADLRERRGGYVQPPPRLDVTRNRLLAACRRLAEAREGIQVAH